jgi:uncharacterized phage-associated protein
MEPTRPLPATGASHPVSAHDVAREIRARDRGAGVLKVQKLLYYCQGWNLALNGDPLFGEEIEAWTNGPVVADLWHAEDKDRAQPPPRTLTDRQLATVAFVCGKYRECSGQQLIEVTHGEPPWLDAIATSAQPNPVITLEALREFFVGQIDPGASALRDDLARHADLRARQLESVARVAAAPPPLDPEGWFEGELSRLS